MITSIFVKKAAKHSLIVEAQKFNLMETGGVLCGTYQGNQLVIEAASGPGLGAMHSIDEFIIDKDHMDHFLDHEYNSSGGLRIYVGEWHTHPQTNPRPSEQDLVSICERTLEWNYGEIAFLIIGFVDFTPEKFAQQSICIVYNKSTQGFFRLPIEFE